MNSLLFSVEVSASPFPFVASMMPSSAIAIRGSRFVGAAA